MDVWGGILVATKHDIDVLKVPQQNHHEIQKQYIFGNDYANTSKDPVETINDRVPTTIASDVDTDIGKKLSDNRSTTMTTKSNEQPMVKRQKQTVQRRLNRKNRL